MPVYEYECRSCGVFSVLRKMHESSLPAPCMDCGEESPRILSAPRLAVMDKGMRSAHERNEKSAHEPRTARKSSCGCSGQHTCNTSAGKSGAAQVNEKTGAPALQMQTKATARPWMVGH